MYYGLCDISGRRGRHWVASVECLGFRGSDLGTNGLCGNSGLRGLRWIACTCCQIFHLFCKLARHFLKLLRGGEGIWIQGLECRVNLRRGLGIQNIGFGLGFQNFFWGISRFVFLDLDVLSLCTRHLLLQSCDLLLQGLYFLLAARQLRIQLTVLSLRTRCRTAPPSPGEKF